MDASAVPSDAFLRHHEVYSTIVTRENDPVRYVRVRVFCVQGLRTTDAQAECYVKVYVRFMHNGVKHVETARTRAFVLAESITWNEEMVFKVCLSHVVMTIKVYLRLPTHEKAFAGKIGNYPVSLDTVVDEGESNVADAGIRTCPLQSSRRRPSQNICGKLKHYIALASGCDLLEAATYSHLGVSSTTTSNFPLPEGWEARCTRNGRMLYVNASTKESSWGHPSETLPVGWERRVTKEGRTFYHNAEMRLTQWISPTARVMESSGENSNSPLGSRSCHDGIVDEEDIYRNRLHDISPTLPVGWIEKISRDGRPYFYNAVDQTSSWTDPRVALVCRTECPKSPSYVTKLKFMLNRIGRPRLPALKICVSRDSIFDTSFRFIMEQAPEMLRHKLWVKFEGETGLDYGGPTKEWFMLVSGQLFNPSYGLFEYANDSATIVQINPLSHLVTRHHLQYFQFAGRIAAMAAYHQSHIDAYFIRPIYKILLAGKITMNDLNSVDVVYYNSLRSILTSNVDEMDLMFSVSTMEMGVMKEHELIDGGSTLQVTNENKKLYVQSLLKWKFIAQVKDQLRCFVKGFSEIIGLRYLAMFHPNELEFLICGLSVIDVQDWKTHTRYRKYNSKSPHIYWFWQVVNTLTEEAQSMLIQFVTGASRIPMNGFSELGSSNGRQLFTIERWGTTDMLPRAHTCFNRLDLPPYESLEVMREKLVLAMKNSHIFDGVD